MDAHFTKPFQNRLAHSPRTLSRFETCRHDRPHEQRIFGQKKGSNIEGQMLENPRQIELLLPILAVLCNNIGVIASRQDNQSTQKVYFISRPLPPGTRDFTFAGTDREVCQKSAFEQRHPYANPSENTFLVLTHSRKSQCQV